MKNFPLKTFIAALAAVSLHVPLASAAVSLEDGEINTVLASDPENPVRDPNAYVGMGGLHKSGLGDYWFENSFSIAQLWVKQGFAGVEGAYTFDGYSATTNAFVSTSLGSAGAHRDAFIVSGGVAAAAVFDLGGDAEVNVRSTHNETLFLRVGYNETTGSTTRGGLLNIYGDAALNVGQQNRYANFHVGDGEGSVGVVNQTGGATTVIGSLNIGFDGGQGTYQISDGLLRISHDDVPGAATSLATIGLNIYSGIETASEGLLHITDSGRVELVRHQLSGGTWGSVNLILGSRDLGATTVKNFGRGEIRQEGGVMHVGAGTVLALSSRGDGEYNLLGGVLEVGGNSLREKYGAGGGTYEFNMGGGTLRAHTSRLSTSVNATLLAGTTAVFDAADVGISWNGTLNGTGALRKVGTRDFSLYGGGTIGEDGVVHEIAEGQFTLDSVLNARGRVEVSNAATLTVEGQLNLFSGAVESADEPMNGLAIGYGNSGTLALGGGQVNLKLEDAVGRISIGRTNGETGGHGVVNMASGSIVLDRTGEGATHGSLDVGRGAGSTGTFNQTGGSVSMSGSAIQIGVTGATGVYTISGPGSSFYAGKDSTLYVGNGEGGNGLLEILNGASFTFGTLGDQATQFYLGSAGEAEGRIVQNGPGTQVSIITGQAVHLARGGANAVYELNAGSLAIGSGTNVDGVMVGEDGDAEFRQTGGDMTVHGNFRVGSGGRGEYTITGGVATFEDRLVLHRSTTEGQGGIVNLHGGTVVIGGSDGIEIRGAGSGAYELTLGNGTLRASSDFSTTANATLSSGAVFTFDTDGRTITWAGALSGDGSVRQVGEGRLVLAGANTYTGPTAIEAGEFRVNGELASSGPVAIGAEATLSGNGVINTHVSIAGRLAPGESIGSLTFNEGLTLEEGSITEIEIFNGVSDTFAITGMFIIEPNATLSFNIGSLGEPGESYSFRLFGETVPNGIFDYVTLTGVTGPVDLDYEHATGIWSLGAPTGGLESFTFNSFGEVTYQAMVPEPGTWMFLLAGGAVFAARLRRRIRG